ncbi:unnamed protein product, partial [Rhizophagus irregularis]
MYVEQKIKTPKDWLLAQLYGLDKESINLISKTCQTEHKELSILIHFINQCLKLNGSSLSKMRRNVFADLNTENTLEVMKQQTMEFFAGLYSSHDRFQFAVTHIISGTNMHMSSGISLVTSVGKEPS